MAILYKKRNFNFTQIKEIHKGHAGGPAKWEVPSVKDGFCPQGAGGGSSFSFSRWPTEHQRSPTCLWGEETSSEPAPAQHREHWHQPQAHTLQSKQHSKPLPLQDRQFSSQCLGHVFWIVLSSPSSASLFAAIPNLPSLSINSFRSPKIDHLSKSSKVSVSTSRELDMDGP